MAKKKRSWPRQEAQMRLKFDELGRELPDPTPVEVPLGFQRPESLTDMVRRMIRGQLSVAAAEEGHETFDEANDFDVPEEDAELHGTEFEEMVVEMPVTAPAPAEAPEKEEEEKEVSEEKESSGSGKVSKKKKVAKEKSSQEVEEEAP